MTLDKFLHELKDLQYEIRHRVGLPFNSKDKTGDGTTGDLIHCVVLQKLQPLLANIESSGEVDNEIAQKFKDEYISEFIGLFHEIVVRRQKFNWNWP